eukprot:Gb_10617 [translate_table: standard]
MPPKKINGGKKEDGKGDESAVEALQAKLIEKGLEIETLSDKIHRLEKRSQHLASLNENQRAQAKDNEEKLRDVIACLTSGLKEKDTKIKELEMLLENTKAETDHSVEVLTKELNDLKSSHKFVVNDLHLQLDNSEVLLRGIDDFNKKRASIEEENVGLKAQLEREKKDHQEAISDVQRTALQEKERLRKEIAARVEETKQQMLLMMDGQLNAKTKRTIVENERLTKELAYHVRQTELLLQKNEKLVNENIELHRKMLLAKEVEEDMARRNHMYQQTMRLLVYKLRDKGLANKADKSEEEDLKWLIGQNKQLKSDIHREHWEQEKLKDKIGERTEAVQSASTEEKVMKFIYACFEDIELEKFGMLPADSGPHLNSDSVFNDGVPTLPTSMDQLTREQRQEFLSAFSFNFIPNIQRFNLSSSSSCFSASMQIDLTGVLIKSCFCKLVQAQLFVSYSLDLLHECIHHDLFLQITQKPVRDPLTFSRHLLRVAISLQAVNPNAALSDLLGTENSTTQLPSTLYIQSKKPGSLDRSTVLVEDILSFPMDMLQLDEQVKKFGGNKRPVSIGVQTEEGDASLMIRVLLTLLDDGNVPNWILWLEQLVTESTADLTNIILRKSGFVSRSMRNV